MRPHILPRVVSGAGQVLGSGRQPSCRQEPSQTGLLSPTLSCSPSLRLSICPETPTETAPTSAVPTGSTHQVHSTGFLFSRVCPTPGPPRTPPLPPSVPLRAVALCSFLQLFPRVLKREEQRPGPEVLLVLGLRLMLQSLSLSSRFWCCGVASPAAATFHLPSPNPKPGGHLRMQTPLREQEGGPDCCSLEGLLGGPALGRLGTWRWEGAQHSRLVSVAGWA